jgi:hypothetical protein
MTRLVVLLVVLTLLLLAAFSNPAAASRPAKPLPPCEAASPVEILDCLAAALNAGDMHALDNLLARDFVSDHKPREDGPTPDPADREMFLKLMRSFVTNDRVKTYTFAFSFEGETPQVEPGTWMLDGVRSTLEVSGTATVWKDGVKSEVQDQRNRVEKLDTFEVREARAPVGLPGDVRHFEIVRWTEGS